MAVSEYPSTPYTAGTVVGVWSCNLRTRVTIANATICEYFSIDPELGRSGVPVNTFYAGIHPADRERVVSIVENAIERGSMFSVTYRVDSHIHGRRWVNAFGQCIRDKDGCPTEFPGLVVDVTDRMQERHVFGEISEHLIAARELAGAAGEDMLRRMIEAVLMEAGFRLAANMERGSLTLN